MVQVHVPQGVEVRVLSWAPLRKNGSKWHVTVSPRTPMPADPTETRSNLLRRLSEIEQALEQAHANAGVVELDHSTNGRLTRMDAMQQAAMASAQLTRLATSKRALLAALDRLERGGYGLCCRCGEHISPARLAHEPATPVCLDCLG